MKFFTAKPLILLLAIGLASVLGQTQLPHAGTGITWVTDDTSPTTGFFKSVTMAYTTDFAAAVVANSPNAGELQLEFGIADVVVKVKDGATLTTSDYYTAIALQAGATTTSFTLDLTRAAVTIATGDYQVIITMSLNYNNNGDTVQMDLGVYTFDISVLGTAGSALFNNAGADATTVGSAYANGVTEETAGAGTVTSVQPASLTVKHTSGGANLEDTIVITASMSNINDDNDFIIWLEEADPIKMDSATSFDTADMVYTWPTGSTRVLSSSSEATGGNTATVTLQSLPVRLWNEGTVYVQMTVHWRDESNDVRRALRVLQGSGGEQLEENSADMVAQIQFGSDDSGATIITSFMVVSVTALSGAALFL